METRSADKQSDVQETNKSGSSSGSTLGRFSHANVFEKLANLALPSDDGADDSTTAPTDQSNRPADEDSMSKMPAWESDFWRTYGNRCRMFGTVEGVAQFG